MGVLGGSSGHDARQTGTQDAGIDAREEQGGAQPLVGDAITLGVGDALNQSVQAQAAQVVGHPAGGEVAGVEAQKRREMCAHVFVGEAVRQETVQDQDAQERLHAWVGEGQRGDTLVADHLGGGSPAGRRPHQGGNRG